MFCPFLNVPINVSYLLKLVNLIREKQTRGKQQKINKIKHTKNKLKIAALDRFDFYLVIGEKRLMFQNLRNNSAIQDFSDKVLCVSVSCAILK